MNIREEMSKSEVSFEEINHKKRLPEIMVNWIKFKKVSDDDYNMILDELQRGLDNRINLTDLDIYSEELKKIVESGAVIPKEMELFLKEHRHYSIINRLNVILKEHKYNDIKDSYSYDDIKNIVWYFYQLGDSCMRNLVEESQLYLEAFFIFMNFMFDYEFKNKYINLDSNNSPIWSLIIVFKRLLEDNDYILLKDIKMLNIKKEAVSFFREWEDSLRKNEIYLFDFYRKSKHKNLTFETMSISNDDPKLFEKEILNVENGKLEYDKNDACASLFRTTFYYELLINKEKKNGLSKSMFKYIALELSKSLAEWTCDNVPFTYLKGNYEEKSAQRRMLLVSNFRENIMKITDEFFENFSDEFSYPFLDKIHYFVNDYSVLLFYKNYFAVCKLNTKLNGSEFFSVEKITIDYYYLSNFDCYEIENDGVSVGVNFSSLLPRGNIKDASITGRAIAGAAIGGGTGALIGALSAVEKNNENQRIRNSKTQSIIHNLKYGELTFKIHCCDLTEYIIFKLYIFNNEDKKEYEMLVQNLNFALDCEIDLENDKKLFNREISTSIKKINDMKSIIDNKIYEYNEIISACEKKLFGKMSSNYTNACEGVEEQEEKKRMYDKYIEKLRSYEV